MSRGYTKHLNIITKAKLKAVQPWHFICHDKGHTST